MSYKKLNLDFKILMIMARYLGEFHTNDREILDHFELLGNITKLF